MPGEVLAIELPASAGLVELQNLLAGSRRNTAADADALEDTQQVCQ